MSFSIAIENGDIAIQGDHFKLVDGTEKLTQDLTVWLKERFQSDRFHPQYGSTLDNYIGGVISNVTVYEIESEVNRVLRNYQSIQVKKFREDPSKFSPAEILAEITNISSNIYYDYLEIYVYFKTYQGTNGKIKLDVSVG